MARRTDAPDFVEAIALAGLPEEDLDDVLAQRSRSGVVARRGPDRAELDTVRTAGEVSADFARHQAVPVAQATG